MKRLVSAAVLYISGNDTTVKNESDYKIPNAEHTASESLI